MPRSEASDVGWPRARNSWADAAPIAPRSTSTSNPLPHNDPLNRVGVFKYENVKGARSNALPDHVPEEVKEERWHRFMEKAQAISEAKLAAKVGRKIDVIVDEIDPDGIATCRTIWDAPEIDGNLFIDEGTEGLEVGQIVGVEVDEAGEYDLWGRVG